MSEPTGTVRRYTLQEPTKYIEGGPFVIPAGITMVKSSDYDALLAQAWELADELQNIANANTRDWDDPTDFKAWAQSRARHALQKAQAVLDATKKGM